ncbi:hypothetical protein [Paraburkholderia youngii]|uniref:hypothetical protein n=1 Tax=Paraburkholderia youngii TaxID=2782701 RepID=UPI001C37A47B|nr:hypothetical protein [Paraburkholderia youngii]
MSAPLPAGSRDEDQTGISNMQMQRELELTMSDIERRAYEAMRDAFERPRYLSKCPLNEQGRRLCSW